MADIITEEERRVPISVDKTTLFERLTQEDRANLEEIAAAFKTAVEKKGLRGALIVVGGILEKPLPRKDIDVRAILETGQKRADYESYLEFARGKFAVMENVVSEIVRVSGATIGEIIEPTMDEQHQNPAILKHEGSITLSCGNRTPIEFMNTTGASLNEHTAGEGRPFCILVSN